MRFHLLLPKIQRAQPQLYDVREGLDIEFPTLITYRQADFEEPSYFAIQILGFGLGIAWDFKEDFWL